MRKMIGEASAYRRRIRLLLVLALVGVGCASHAAVTVNGAGATFPYPLYSRWAYKYNQITGMQLNYQSIGSGGGIQQIKAGTVDFGASDAPLAAAELKASRLVQFPMVVGGVVPVVNIPGHGMLRGEKPAPKHTVRLSPKVLADVFLGKITKWNDPAIKSLNRGMRLPSTSITVVHRADGSGTTWIFTNYLAKVSPGWAKNVGVGKSVAWPCGVGGKGNEGVAAYVQRVKGSIGYVEYAYALQNRMTTVRLRNRAGAFTSPSIRSFAAAAANANWKKAPGYGVVLTDQPGKDTWPISGASFILVRKEQRDADRAAAMLKFFDWCYRHGAATAKELNYVPMPRNVYELVEKTWKAEIRSKGRGLRV